MAYAADINIQIIQILVLMPPVLLLTSLPISFSGWGVREGAIIFFFGLIGIIKTEAITISIILGLLTMLVSITGALVWLSEKPKKKDKYQNS